jgi:hypothetical protein
MPFKKFLSDVSRTPVLAGNIRIRVEAVGGGDG